MSFPWMYFSTASRNKNLVINEAVKEISPEQFEHNLKTYPIMYVSVNAGIVRYRLEHPTIPIFLVATSTMRPNKDEALTTYMFEIQIESHKLSPEQQNVVMGVWSNWPYQLKEKLKSSVLSAKKKISSAKSSTKKKVSSAASSAKKKVSSAASSAKKQVQKTAGSVKKAVREVLSATKSKIHKSTTPSSSSRSKANSSSKSKSKGSVSKSKSSSKKSKSKSK